MKKIHLSVQGMTCSSCEVLIERKLRKVPGVTHVNVNQRKGEARVEYTGDVSVTDLQNALAGEKYTLTSQQEGSLGHSLITPDKERWAEIGSVVVIIFGAYLLLTQLDLLPQGLGITDNMSYGVIFLVGLVAAASTCLAVAGGLLLAVAGKYQEKYPHLTGWQKFKPHISFNIGRIASYTILGGVIGLLGSQLVISPQVTGVITIIASLLMILVGIQLLHVFPWLNTIQIKMPKFFAHRLYDASAEAPRTRSSFLFGAATFFLPCGFTQALQLYVLGKGDFTTGALTMLAFSLGTLPTLAGIGAFSSFTTGEFQRHFVTFSAVLVIALGIFNIPNGLSLTGATIAFPIATAPALENVNVVDGKQIVELTVAGLDYVPSQFTIQVGIPVEWRIDGRTAQGCAQVISAPQLGINEYLPRDQIKTITFTPQQPGTIRFTCSMGMAGPGFFQVVAQ